MSQNYCQACEDDMENQQAHFGGCIPYPYFYEDDIFNSEVEAASLHFLLLKMKSASTNHLRRHGEGHFVATQIP